MSKEVSFIYKGTIIVIRYIIFLVEFHAYAENCAKHVRTIRTVLNSIIPNFCAT